jgi:hypothetical protein
VASGRLRRSVGTFEYQILEEKNQEGEMDCVGIANPVLFYTPKT